MNYVLVASGTGENNFEGSEEFLDEDEPTKDYEDDKDQIIMPIWDFVENDDVAKKEDPQPSTAIGKEGDAEVVNLEAQNKDIPESSHCYTRNFH